MTPALTAPAREGEHALTSALDAIAYSPALGSTVRRLILAVVTLVASMEFLTSYAIGVALPDIQGELSASSDEGSWILTTYSTCFLIGLALSNWLSARIGYRRHMIAAVVLYTGASIACGLSHSLSEMLIFRGVMGLAGGVFLVRAQASINLAYVGKDRAKALTVMSFGLVCVARLCGAAVGGYLTEWYSWRAIFFLNVPLAIAALLMLVLALPDFKARLLEPARRFDVVGMILLIAWVGSLQIALSRGERDDWLADPLIATLLAIAAIALPLFVWWECRRASTAPIISLRTYLNRDFVIGSIYVIVLGMMLYGQLYAVPQFLRSVQHHSAWGTGQLQSFNAVFFAIGLVTGARLMQRLGLRRDLFVGAAFFTLGMWCWASRLSPDISDAAMLLPLALTGLGAGWQIAPLSTLINIDTPPTLMGEGMELYLLQRQLGGSWGTAILAILLDRRESFWSGRLGEHLSEYEIAGHVTGNAVTQGAAALQSAGLANADAEAGAMALLHGRLITQAFVNAYVDQFHYQMLLGVVGLGLTICLAKASVVPGVLRWVLLWR